MKRAPLLAAIVLPLLAAPTIARDRHGLDGQIAGPAQQCVSLSRVLGPQIIDDRTIVYRQTGRRYWVTHPADPCPSLRSGDFSTLIVEPTGGQLCRNDRFRVRSPNSIIPGPPCRFGSFTPYDRPER